MLSKLHKNSKGFTLVELMIVVVIIGILAALAIPRFMRTTTKAKQSEAKGILKQIYVMETAFKQEKEHYTANKDSIGVQIPSNARYTYTVDVADTILFHAYASANLDDDATLDIWTITQDGVLACSTGHDDSQQ
jgi:prepilin-type N-terminal cleavage/methylation domain-containing protein